MSNLHAGFNWLWLLLMPRDLAKKYHMYCWRKIKPAPGRFFCFRFPSEEGEKKRPGPGFRFPVRSCGKSKSPLMGCSEWGTRSDFLFHGELVCLSSHTRAHFYLRHLQHDTHTQRCTRAERYVYVRVVRSGTSVSSRRRPGVASSCLIQIR